MVLLGETSCVSVCVMSSSNDKAQSPVTGASSSKFQVAQLASLVDSGENEKPEEELPKQKHGQKKDTHECKLMACFEVKDNEPDNIDNLVFT